MYIRTPIIQNQKWYAYYKNYTTYNVKYMCTIIIPSDKSTSPGIYLCPSLHCGPSILIVHRSPRKFPRLHLRQLFMWRELLFKKICSYNRP